ncbi:MAG: hypothetical protein HY349_07850 [Nitrospirae bacterium]|nr:hypothetical protein [Nitrospirota bacterium]
MRLSQLLRREMSIAWSGLEKVVVSAAEQTARQAEILRLSFKIHDREKALDAVFERMGRFLRESQEMDQGALTAHSTCQACFSEFKRLQGELKFIERRRYDLQEENVTTKWAEFVESVYKSGMTLESLTLPFHMKPPSMTLQEMALPQGVLVIAIQRKERFIQPHGSVLLRRSDRLTLLGPPQQIIQVLERFRSPQ